jgi:hypothetical protein
MLSRSLGESCRARDASLRARPEDLEVEATLAGTLGERLDAPVVHV